MNHQLSEFFGEFEQSFHPSTPIRGENAPAWQVSGVWSGDMKRFLDAQFSREALPGSARQCAAMISDAKGRVYAVVWMWDHNKVNDRFANEGFKELLNSHAPCKIAIVHTRADGSDGDEHADESIRRILQAYRQDGRNGGPVGLIEIRRTRDDPTSVTFHCTCSDLSSGETIRFEPWTYST